MSSSSDNQTLLLPHNHLLSLHLASQITNRALLPSNNKHIVSCRLLSPGLIELQLSAGETPGYGSRIWPLWIGGAGIGDDDQFVASFGGEPRGPVAVRFAVPIAMLGVDDAGFCDASFWENHSSSPPSLHSIAVKAVSWLEGTQFDNYCMTDNDNTTATANNTANIDPEEKTRLQNRWREDQSHTAAKLKVIQQFAMSMTTTTTKQQPTPPLCLVGQTIFQSDWIAPPFQRFFHPNNSQSDHDTSIIDWSNLVDPIGPGLFAFDLFSPSFCKLLIAQADAFDSTGLPARRPNTMNKLGLVINDVGLEPLMSTLLSHLVAPMCKALFPNEMICEALDHHHSFLVRYKANDNKNNTTKNTDEATTTAKSATPTQQEEEGTRGLDMHHDAAEATLNVCLGRGSFHGGDLVFCGGLNTTKHRTLQQNVTHKLGRAILHLGRHRHGADDIERGERINLIMWAKNSAYRGAAAYGHVPLDGYGSTTRGRSGENSGDLILPDRVCLSKANDVDYEMQMKRFET